MDTLKIKLAISAAWRASSKLETLANGNLSAMDEINNIRREIYILQTELGIVRPLDELQAEQAPRQTK